MRYQIGLFDSFTKMFERLDNSFSLEKINICSFKESKLFLVLFIVLNNDLRYMCVLSVIGIGL